MRRLLFIIFFFNFSIAYSQKDQGCANPMNVKLLIKGMNSHDTLITMKQLLTAEEVFVENSRIQILSFTAGLHDNNGEIDEFSVIGTKFSENNKKQFSKLRFQSLIYFDNIKAKNQQGFIVCLKPVLYRIVE